MRNGKKMVALALPRHQGTKASLAALIGGVLTFLAMVGLAAIAHGSIVTIGLNYEFSGATASEGHPPWLMPEFNDELEELDENTVRLTMWANNLVAIEFVSEWYFNFKPDLDSSQLDFSLVETSGPVPVKISTGSNAFQADGDGKFDIAFLFPTKGGTERFSSGETVIYDISYTSPISATDFYFSSVEGGGNGSYHSAAHIQGIGAQGELSGWIGDSAKPLGDVPEPASVLIWVAVIVGCAGLGLFWRFKKSIP